jgi:hypothetical protein
MKRHPGFLLAAAVMVGLASSPGARADLFQSGTSFTIGGTNFVDNYSQLVPLAAGTYSVDSGKLTLTESIIPVDSTHEWLQLAFKTTGGGSVAGNVNANWAFQTSGVQFTEPWRFMNFFTYWTQNGVAVPNIKPFGSGGLSVVNPNPLDPSLGEVFGGVPNQIYPSGPNPTFTSNLTQPDFNLIFVNPFSFVTAGNVPTSVDGYVAAMEFEGAQPFTSTPEPSTLALCAAGVVSLAGGSWWRRRRVAR